MRGHQPFFLGAALLAIVSMALWLAALEGSMQMPSGAPAAHWHAHEMLFGYTVAVLAGFLLGGGAGWQPPLLFLVWLAGRIAAVAGPAELSAALDLALLPALALLRTPPLWRGFKWPTVGFLPLLLMLFVAELLWHLDALGRFPGGAAAGTRLAVDLFTLMIVVMAGRLVPGYTRAMLIPVRTPKDPGRERASVGIAVALLVFDQVDWSAGVAAAALALGALQAWRLAGWRTRDVLSRPILLVLHLGYGWLVFGLFLRGLAELTALIAPADAVHATTVGAIGMLTLGMMGRLARTHARRALAAAPADMLSYGAMFAAAFARSLLPALVPEARRGALLAAGLLWSLAFALFLWAHGGTLVRARPRRED
ncbi:MAG: NnrS family protein [Rhodospirillales bacterium]|nr:NnrS family protein [Rhodospirillales bacterium]